MLRPGREVKDRGRSRGGWRENLVARASRPLDKVVESRLSRIWVTLHESKSQSLRGYGAVPEKLKEYLDPRVDGILGLLARLREALGEARMEEKNERSSNL